MTDKKEQVRDLLKSLKDPLTMELLVQHGADQKDLETNITTVLGYITKGGKVRKGVYVPPFDVIYTTIVNVGIPNILALLVNPRIGPSPKKEEVNKIITAVKTLAYRWAPQPIIHPQYAGLPTADNLMRWKDQWGYNIFDTPKRKLADSALLKYEKKYKKKLHKPEVKPSDPVEHAPDPYTGRKK